MTEAPELLTVFHVDGRSYALPVGAIAEAVRMVALTPVPQTPDWHAGVLDLRGEVIPVVDLRSMLGLTPREPGLDTRILVVDGERRAGLLVDEIEGVVDSPAAAQPPAGERFVAAVLHSGEGMIVVLDLHSLLENLGEHAT